MGGLREIVAAYDILVRALSVLAGVIVGVDCLLIVIDVTVRTLGVPPPAYTIAVVEYSLLYVAMFAAPHLVRIKGHVFINALIARLPRRLEIALAKIVYVISIASSLVYAWYSLDLLIEAINTGIYDERGVDMPLWSLYLPIPIGFLLVAIEFARFLFGSDLMHRGQTEAEGSV